MENRNKKWPTIGNSHVADFLEKSIKNKRLVSAYIFLGPDDLGKTSFARYFSQLLLCSAGNSGQVCGLCESCRHFAKKHRNDTSGGHDNQVELDLSHGDFHILKRQTDKKNISVEQVRQFIRHLNMSSFLRSYKVGVIKNAHYLSLEAGNALLKTLEEPKNKVVVIMTASGLEHIPATIASRSQVLNFYPVNSDIIYENLVSEHKATRSQAKNLSRLCLGRPALALKFFYDEDFLNNYLQAAGNFIKIIQSDLVSRGSYVEDTIGYGKNDQEGAREALKVIDIWRGVARDMLLFSMGRKDLMQFEIIGNEIAALPPRKFNVVNILNTFKVINENKTYIKNNVSPKMALENIAFNI